jgi:hypothetical protein
MGMFDAQIVAGTVEKVIAVDEADPAIQFGMKPLTPESR